VYHSPECGWAPRDAEQRRVEQQGLLRHLQHGQLLLLQTQTVAVLLAMNKLPLTP
jgi:hypothetical protein